MTESTGPKISSWAIRAIGATPAKIVGSKKTPWSRPPTGRPVAAADELALAPADLDVLLDLGRRGLVDERPDVGRRHQPVAEPQGPDAAVRASRRVGRRPRPRTITRLQAVQRWPVVPNADQRIPSTARSRSASAQDDDRVLAAELQARRA